MMRSLYSGVAGLKTHQTRMDVIGNNIANVNTVGFKGSSVNFSDTFYQTVSSATGANADNGTAGTNAKQIGLGSTVAAITTNITEQGGTSSTNRALDVAINGEAFLIVSDGTQSLFTKSGALNVDEAGNLYCTTNGCIVQGWLVDPTDKTKIVKDTVKNLAVMSPENMYYEPEATASVTLSGNLDPNDPDLPFDDANGEVMTFSFFDKLGETYTTKMSIKHAEACELDGSGDPDPTKPLGVDAVGQYVVSINDIYDSNGDSILVQKNVTDSGMVFYTAKTDVKFSFGDMDIALDSNFTDYYAKLTGYYNGTETDKPDFPTSFDAITGPTYTDGKLTANGTGSFYVDPNTGEVIINGASQGLSFSTANGDYVGITPARSNTQFKDAINFSITQKDGLVGNETTFEQYNATTDSGGINIFFNGLTQYSTGGTSKLASTKGDASGLGVGNKAGNMTGIAIDGEGKIWGTYDNGMKGLLGQLAVATFANPSGLESLGESLFAASLNSGEFDGVGEEISLSGSLTVGALEMSNVDLASEFTNMIITQRGFQANSRIITTSDSMLEELVNLKR